MATLTVQRRVGLATLVEEHQAMVWRYLRFLGSEEALADDLAQETFLAVCRKPFEDRGPAATAAYLRTVARNQFLMAMRRQRRTVTVESLDAADAVWDEHVAEAGHDAFREALAECLETINGRGRQAIDLRYRDGASRAEMAQTLEMTTEGVKTLLRRTRELLRRCVEGRTKS